MVQHMSLIMEVNNYIHTYNISRLLYTYVQDIDHECAPSEHSLVIGKLKIR